MANITRFNPFPESFDDLFRSLMWRPPLAEQAALPQIKMDVSEDEKAYTVRAELPGVKKEDIKVSVEGNTVAISAEVTREKEEKKGEKLLHSERYHGSLYRSFSLAQDVNEAAAQARFSDGVLELTLPKNLTARSRQVAIQ